MNKHIKKFKAKVFAWRLFRAELFGSWKYDGLVGYEPWGWPRARVLYPPEPKMGFEGGVSTVMAMGNAVDYASLFNGKVVPVDYEVTGS